MLLRRFNKQFILEVLSIILELNYFYINGINCNETKFFVVSSNLVVTYEQIKIFTLLLSLLDKVFYEWLENFDAEPFYNMINNLDSVLKSIFENPSKS